MAGSIVASCKASSREASLGRYAMKTETNRCASAGLLRFGRRRHRAFRCDLSGNSDLDSSYRHHWSSNAALVPRARSRCPRWKIATNIVIAGSLHSKEP